MMRGSFETVLRAITVVAAMAWAAPAWSEVVWQKPCPHASPCLVFSSTGDLPPARTIDVTAPAKGVAIVSFHGSMTCTSSHKSDRAVSLAAQITAPTDSFPDGDQSGGLNLGAILSSAPDHDFGGQTTFNLSTVRVYKVKANERLELGFVIRRISMSTFVTCEVGRNSGFVVDFRD